MSWLVMCSLRKVVVWTLMCALALAGISVASAQSTMDPSIDSDGDGHHNGMDFDDDNDDVADDIDCAPFDSRYGSTCPTPTTPSSGTMTPPTETPTSENPTQTPVPPGNSSPDNDGDGLEDRFDPDDDNDGITDEHDSAPLDPNLGTQPTPSTTDPGADNDDDGIENSHDPDDDNDGVMDSQDSHPFDPTRGEKPPPSIIDPDTDSDGDGIMNSHDPDDDNDGAVDEVDCAPFDSSVGECSGEATPVGGDPGGPTRQGTAGEWRGGGNGPFLVTSLPSTGSGDAEAAPLSGSPVPAFVVLVAVVMLCCWAGRSFGVHARKSIRHREEETR